MTSLEELNLDETVPLEYSLRRAAKVKEISEYIADFLRRPEHSMAIAKRIMEQAEEMGRIDGDRVRGEVPSNRTANGNPLAFTI